MIRTVKLGEARRICRALGILWASLEAPDEEAAEGICRQPLKIVDRDRNLSDKAPEEQIEQAA